VRHARQLNREVLGQRRKWPTRFGQHNTCGNNSGTNGRQLGCTQCGCTHQYGHNYNYYYNYDNNHHHNYNNHDYDNYDSRTDHDNVYDYINNFDVNNIYDGCTDDYNNFDINNIYDGCTDDYIIYDGSTDDFDYVNNNRTANDSSTSCGQRIQQQLVHVEQRTETATQQTCISFARRRCSDVRGVSRVQCPPPRQPAYGETVAIGMRLSRNPSSRAGGHPKRAVHPVSHGSDHVL
jgi:hypothetical protein